MNTNLKQRRVGLTLEMDEFVEERSKQLGLPSVPEYIRYLIVTDKVKEEPEYVELSEAAKKRYAQMEEDINKGVNLIPLKKGIPLSEQI